MRVEIGQNQWLSLCDDLSDQPTPLRWMIKNWVQDDSLYVNLEKQDIDGWYDEDGDQVGSLVVVAADAPVKNDGKSRAAKSLFENMWHESGRELLNDCPFVSNAFSQGIFEKMGHSQATAKKYAFGTQDRGPLGQLRKKEHIEKHQSGWYVCEPLWLLILKGVEQNGT